MQLAAAAVCLLAVPMFPGRMQVYVSHHSSSAGVDIFSSVAWGTLGHDALPASSCVASSSQGDTRRRPCEVDAAAAELFSLPFRTEAPRSPDLRFTGRPSLRKQPPGCLTLAELIPMNLASQLFRVAQQTPVTLPDQSMAHAVSKAGVGMGGCAR